jgi:SAM-dependent methyltransferase
MATAPEGGAPVADYQGNQAFSAINRYLHAARYHELRRFLSLVLTGEEPRIFEVGCGYGDAVDVIRSVLGERAFKYYGVDYWAAFVEQANATRSAPDVRFENRDLRDMAEEGFRLPEPPDCIIALETMEHVTELDVPKIVDWLARMKVPTLITVPNEVGPALLVKNLGSALMGYRRHREYRIQDTLNAAFGRMERLRAHGTGHLGFDWRWLLSVLKQRFTVEVRTSPLPFVPRSLAPSIFFYCWPRDWADPPRSQRPLNV